MKSFVKDYFVLSFVLVFVSINLCSDQCLGQDVGQQQLNVVPTDVSYLYQQDQSQTDPVSFTKIKGLTLFVDHTVVRHQISIRWT
jgi:hypothetical protein